MSFPWDPPLPADGESWVRKYSVRTKTAEKEEAALHSILHTALSLPQEGADLLLRRSRRSTAQPSVHMGAGEKQRCHDHPNGAEKQRMVAAAAQPSPPQAASAPLSALSLFSNNLSSSQGPEAGPSVDASATIPRALSPVVFAAVFEGVERRYSTTRRQDRRLAWVRVPTALNLMPRIDRSSAADAARVPLLPSVAGFIVLFKGSAAPPQDVFQKVLGLSLFEGTSSGGGGVDSSSTTTRAAAISAAAAIRQATDAVDRCVAGIRGVVPLFTGDISGIGSLAATTSGPGLGFADADYFSSVPSSPPPLPPPQSKNIQEMVGRSLVVCSDPRGRASRHPSMQPHLLRAMQRALDFVISECRERTELLRREEQQQQQQQKQEQEQRRHRDDSPVRDDAAAAATVASGLYDIQLYGPDDDEDEGDPSPPPPHLSSIHSSAASTSAVSPAVAIASARARLLSRLFKALLEPIDKRRLSRTYVLMFRAPSDRAEWQALLQASTIVAPLQRLSVLRQWITTGWSAIFPALLGRSRVVVPVVGGGHASEGDDDNRITSEAAVGSQWVVVRRWGMWAAAYPEAARRTRRGRDRAGEGAAEGEKEPSTNPLTVAALARRDSMDEAEGDDHDPFGATIVSDGDGSHHTATSTDESSTATTDALASTISSIQDKREQRNQQPSSFAAFATNTAGAYFTIQRREHDPSDPVTTTVTPPSQCLALTAACTVDSIVTAGDAATGLRWVSEAQQGTVWALERTSCCDEEEHAQALSDVGACRYQLVAVASPQWVLRVETRNAAAAEGIRGGGGGKDSEDEIVAEHVLVLRHREDIKTRHRLDSLSSHPHSSHLHVAAVVAPAHAHAHAPHLHSHPHPRLVLTMTPLTCSKGTRTKPMVVEDHHKRGATTATTTTLFRALPLVPRSTTTLDAAIAPSSGAAAGGFLEVVPCCPPPFHFHQNDQHNDRDPPRDTPLRDDAGHGPVTAAVRPMHWLEPMTAAQRRGLLQQAELLQQAAWRRPARRIHKAAVVAVPSPRHLVAAAVDSSGDSSAADGDDDDVEGEEGKPAASALPPLAPFPVMSNDRLADPLRLLLIGPPGGGKTTLLGWWWAASVETARSAAIGGASFRYAVGAAQKQMVVRVGGGALLAPCLATDLPGTASTPLVASHAASTDIFVIVFDLRDPIALRGVEEKQLPLLARQAPPSSTFVLAGTYDGNPRACISRFLVEEVVARGKALRRQASLKNGTSSMLTEKDCDTWVIWNIPEGFDDGQNASFGGSPDRGRRGPASPTPPVTGPSPSSPPGEATAGFGTLLDNVNKLVAPSSPSSPLAATVTAVAEHTPERLTAVQNRSFSSRLSDGRNVGAEAAVRELSAVVDIVHARRVAANAALPRDVVHGLIVAMTDAVLDTTSPKQSTGATGSSAAIWPSGPPAASDGWRPVCGPEDSQWLPHAQHQLRLRDAYAICGAVVRRAGFDVFGAQVAVTEMLRDYHDLCAYRSAAVTSGGHGGTDSDSDADARDREGDGSGGVNVTSTNGEGLTGDGGGGGLWAGLRRRLQWRRQRQVGVRKALRSMATTTTRAVSRPIAAVARAASRTLRRRMRVMGSVFSPHRGVGDGGGDGEAGRRARSDGRGSKGASGSGSGSGGGGGRVPRDFWSLVHDLLATRCARQHFATSIPDACNAPLSPLWLVLRWLVALRQVLDPRAEIFCVGMAHASRQKDVLDEPADRHDHHAASPWRGSYHAGAGEEEGEYGMSDPPLVIVEALSILGRSGAWSAAGSPRTAASTAAGGAEVALSQRHVVHLASTVAVHDAGRFEAHGGRLHQTQPLLFREMRDHGEQGQGGMGPRDGGLAGRAEVASWLQALQHGRTFGGHQSFVLGAVFAARFAPLARFIVEQHRQHHHHPSQSTTTIGTNAPTFLATSFCSPEPAATAKGMMPPSHPPSSSNFLAQALGALVLPKPVGAQGPPRRLSFLSRDGARGRAEDEADAAEAAAAAAPTCFRCSALFGVARWRHACEGCRRRFCGECLGEPKVLLERWGPSELPPRPPFLDDAALLRARLATLCDGCFADRAMRRRDAAPAAAAGPYRRVHFLVPRPEAAARDVAVAGWQADADCGNCPLCHSPFTALLNRRHHCRQCGSVCCADCSVGRAPVAGYSGPQRVCHDCYVTHTLDPMAEPDDDHGDYSHLSGECEQDSPLRGILKRPLTADDVRRRAFIASLRLRPDDPTRAATAYEEEGVMVGGSNAQRTRQVEEEAREAALMQAFVAGRPLPPAGRGPSIVAIPSLTALPTHTEGTEADAEAEAQRRSLLVWDREDEDALRGRMRRALATALALDEIDDDGALLDLFAGQPSLLPLPPACPWWEASTSSASSLAHRADASSPLTQQHEAVPAVHTPPQPLPPVRKEPLVVPQHIYDSITAIPRQAYAVAACGYDSGADEAVEQAEAASRRYAPDDEDLVMGPDIYLP